MCFYYLIQYIQNDSFAMDLNGTLYMQIFVKIEPKIKREPLITVSRTQAFLETISPMHCYDMGHTHGL
jgi:hypothetical protein